MFQRQNEGKIRGRANRIFLYFEIILTPPKLSMSLLRFLFLFEEVHSQNVVGFLA